MVRVAVMLVLFVSPGAWAQADLRVSEAIRHYDGGEFSQAKDTLVTVVESPSLTRAQRSRARIYLSAAYYALGDIASSKAQLLALARQDPSAKIDPALFVPELVALFDDARAEVASELAARPVEPPPANPVQKEPPPKETAPLAGPRLVPVEAAPRPRAPGYLALIPFGAGQFANGDAGKGVLFLAGEVVLFGTAVGTLLAFESMKLDDGQRVFLRSGTFRAEDLPLANTLHLAYHVAFYAGLALAGTGIAEAVLTRLSRSQGSTAAWTFTGNSVAVRF